MMAGWLAHSREAIYDVDLDPPRPSLDKTKNYVTTMGHTWYAMPDEKDAVFVNDIGRPQSVTLLRTGEKLAHQYRDDTLRVVVPARLRTTLPDMVKIVMSP